MLVLSFTISCLDSYGQCGTNVADNRRDGRASSGNLSNGRWRLATGRSGSIVVEGSHRLLDWSRHLPSLSWADIGGLSIC
jgi:hypothetical protein